MRVKMEQFVRCLQGIVFSPTKTFRAIAKEKKAPLSFLLTIAICLQVLIILQLLLAPQENQDITSTSSTYNNFVIYFSKFYPLLIVPLWLVDAAIIYAVARRYSTKGSLISLAIALGLTRFIANIFGVAQATVTVHTGLTNQTLFLFLFIPFYLWIIYLQILAISIIYTLSKGRAFLISLVSPFIFLLLYVGILLFLYR